MKMNSRRLRIAIEAPKLAITKAIALPCRRRRLNSNQSRRSAIPPVRAMAAAVAKMSLQPNDSEPMGTMEPVSVPTAPEMTSIATVCAVFARLKGRLVDAGAGEEPYYAILAEFGGGAKHANELKQKAARQCAWRIYDIILEAELKLEAPREPYEEEPLP